MTLDLGRATWRGIVELEADRVALRDATGAPHDIRDLFLPQDAIATVREAVTDVGGGLVHSPLTWDDEDGRPPTDDQVPGLASLLSAAMGGRGAPDDQKLLRDTAALPAPLVGGGALVREPARGGVAARLRVQRQVRADPLAVFAETDRGPDARAESRVAAVRRGARHQ
jgi:hypothetical protein